jgi:two-component system chemotaxis sensor kinase CheA
MDVVRTNVEQIGGAIDLQSRPGLGTTVRVKIPLTLAIIPALVVASGDNRYAIPQASLLELMHLEGDDARDGIELLYGTPVHRLRGKLLPLVYLSDALGLGSEASRIEQLRAGGAGGAGGAGDRRAEVNIIVLQADDRRFGLVVEDVHDTEEIVVKPLGKHFKASPVFAGATIMGDGRIALILDVLGLAKHARVVADGHERVRLEQSIITAAAAEDDRQTMLVFRSPDDGRMALPLSRVARLEELPRSALERTGHELVMQYRGEIVPMIELSMVVVERRAVLRSPAPPPDDIMQVIMFSHDGGRIGLIVDQIIDIVEQTLGEARPAARPGVLGSVVIAGRITELLDVDAVLRRAQPGAAWRAEARPDAMPETIIEERDHGA